MIPVATMREVLLDKATRTVHRLCPRIVEGVAAGDLRHSRMVADSARRFFAFELSAYRLRQRLMLKEEAAWR